jgi:hypothetical protein
MGAQPPTGVGVSTPCLMLLHFHQLIGGRSHSSSRVYGGSPSF